MVTLYHWDLPAALEDRGGWADPRSADWFAEYAQLMYRTLGDRVRDVGDDQRAVGDRGSRLRRRPARTGPRDWAEAAAVSKNLLRAHAAAVAAYRADGNMQIGLVVNLVPIHPASDAAGRSRKRRSGWTRISTGSSSIRRCLGEVPGELAEMFGTAWPQWTADELRQIRAADRFRRRQLLFAAGGARRSRRPAPRGLASCRSPTVRIRRWVGRFTRRGLTETLQWVNEPLRRFAALHHRKWRGVRR